MFVKKLLVYFCPILIFIGLELFSYDLSYIYYLSGLTLFILFLSLKLLIRAKLFSRDFWGLAILPLLLLVATIGVLLLVTSGIAEHLIIIFLALILAVYLENIFTYFYNQSLYQPFSFENLAAFFDLIIFVLVVIDLTAFNVFLNLPVWLLSLICLLVLTILIDQALWVNKINNDLKYIYLLIVDLIILEFYWAMSFLPSNFYANSIIISLVFYLTWGLFKAKLTDRLNKNVFFSYVGISLTLLFIIVITSHWT
jgi:hypothetical protein